MKKSKHKRSSKKNNSKGSSSSNGENDLTSGKIFFKSSLTTL